MRLNDNDRVSDSWYLLRADSTSSLFDCLTQDVGGLRPKLRAW
jgi:hypothetical protein